MNKEAYEGHNVKSVELHGPKLLATIDYCMNIYHKTCILYWKTGPDCSVLGMTYWSQDLFVLQKTDVTF